MPHLVTNFAAGWLAAQCFVAGLLLFDVGGLGALVAAAEQPLLPVTMLSLSLGTLVGAASLATNAPSIQRRRSGRTLPAPALVRVRSDR